MGPETRSRHLDPERLRRLVASARPEPAADAAERAHLAACRPCREELGMLAALASAPPPARPERPCPDPEALILHAGRTRPVEGVVEKHLRQCLPCAVEAERLKAAGGARRLPGARRRSIVADLADRLRALVSFEPPLRLELVTRGGRARGGAAYREAMRAYEEGRLDAACTGLLRAERDGESAPDLAFYLGICLLAGGRGTEAASRLARAAAQASDLGEYRWYLAQAHLQAGAGAQARVELKRAAALPGPFASSARRLDRRVAEVLRETPGARPGS